MAAACRRSGSEGEPVGSHPQHGSSSSARIIASRAFLGSTLIECGEPVLVSEAKPACAKLAEDLQRVEQIVVATVVLPD
jgi:hypothetical protein